MNVSDQPFDLRDTARPSHVITQIFLAALIATPLLRAFCHPPFSALIEDQPNRTLWGFIFMLPLMGADMAVDLIGLFSQPVCAPTCASADAARGRGPGWLATV